MTTGHGLTEQGVADAGAFLARLVKVEPAAVVRLRPAGPSGIALWARLPWDVLVTRTVAGSRADDATVGARDLLTSLGGTGSLPGRRDADWRWAVPSGSGTAVESIPADTVRRLGVAAEQAARAVAAGGLGSGRVVGERVLRDALLDHAAIVVESVSTVDRVTVPQRLVQAVVRMGFLSRAAGEGEPEVRVLVTGGFVGLAAQYGVAWHSRASGLMVRSIDRTAGHS